MEDQEQAAVQAAIVAQQTELIAALEAALADAESRASAAMEGARWEAKARRLEKQLDALRKASEEGARRMQEQLLAAEMQASASAASSSHGANGVGDAKDGSVVEVEQREKYLALMAELEAERRVAHDAKALAEAAEAAQRRAEEERDTAVAAARQSREDLAEKSLHERRQLEEALKTTEAQREQLKERVAAAELQARTEAVQRTQLADEYAALQRTHSEEARLAAETIEQLRGELQAAHENEELLRKAQIEQQERLAAEHAKALQEERNSREAAEAEGALLRDSLASVRASADKQYLETLSLEDQLQAARAAAASPPPPPAPAPEQPSAAEETAERLVAILRDQIRVLHAQVKVLRSSAALDEERMQDLRADLTAAQAETSERVAEAARSTALLQGALLGARRDLAAAQAAQHTAVLEARAAREALEKSMEERAAAERSAVQQSSAAADALAVVEAMRETHRQEVARMQQALADVRLQLLDQTQLEEAAATARAEAAERVAHIDSERAAASAALDAARADNAQLRQELDTLTANLSAEQRARAAAEANNAELTNEIRRLRESLERLQSAKAAAEREALQRELELIDTLEAQLRDLRLLQDVPPPTVLPAPRTAIPSKSRDAVATTTTGRVHQQQPPQQQQQLPVSVLTRNGTSTAPAVGKRQVLTALSEERRALSQARQKLVEELWSRSVALLPSRKPREYAFLTPISTPSK